MPELFKHVQISWDGFLVTLAIFLALLFVRLLLPAGRRRHGRIALILLGLSLVLRLVAGGLGQLERPGVANVIAFVAVFAGAFGIAGTVALVLFDIGLARLRVQVPSLVRDIVVAVAAAVITIALLQDAGVNLVGLITTSAVLTAVVGLALQSTISNLFAGLSLQMDRTIAVGDWVKIGSRVGRVAEIKWRSTLLVTRDGENVILPNAHFLSNEVCNFSKPAPEHRLTMTVGVHYRHPPNEVKQVLLSAVEGVEGALANPPPDCLPVEFADSFILYALRYWVRDVARETAIDGEVRTRVWYATQRAGIEIPVPIRNVLMTQISAETLLQEHEKGFIDRRAALAETELFRNLAEPDRELLARGLKTVRFGAGERIIRQGDPGDSLYLVAAGEVVVRLAVDGAEREVATLRAGQFFGEMSLMTGEPRRATCAAKGDATCYVVLHSALASVLESKPEIAEQISRILAERQSALEGERDNLSAEARARRAAENGARLLARIRDFFHLG